MTEPNLSGNDVLYREIVERNLGVYTGAEQARLRASRVLICGLGGVGGMEAVLAARLGVGAITGVDPDVFEVSNLNRQAFALVSTLGRPKAEAATDVLRDINPTTELDMRAVRIEESNADELIAGHDLVLEAVDDMVSRVVIHRAARRLRVPSVAMSGSPPHRGFVSTFLPDGPSYEDTLGLPSAGRVLSDDVRGEIAAVKAARARFSIGRGAPAAWADAYLAGTAGWTITVIRAVLLASFAVHEAAQVLIGRLPAAAAPKGYLIDLDANPPVAVEEPPGGVWDAAQL